MDCGSMHNSETIDLRQTDLRSESAIILNAGALWAIEKNLELA